VVTSPGKGATRAKATYGGTILKNVVVSTGGQGTLPWGETVSFVDPLTGDPIEFTIGPPQVDAAAHTKKGRKLVRFWVTVTNSAPAGYPEFSLGAFELRDASGERYNAIDMVEGVLGTLVVPGGRFNKAVSWEIPEAHVPVSLTVSLTAKGMDEYSFTWRDEG
jgi:hypothetical protein